MIFLYNSILFLFSIPILVFILFRYGKRSKTEFFYKLPERFGIYKRGIYPEKGSLWFHCASLGEVKAVEPLLRNLRGKHKVIITTMTFAGRKYSEENDLADSILYVPLDFSFIVQKYISFFRPKCLILIETELWPGLIFTAKKNNLKVALINARLSDFSFNHYVLLRFFWQRVINSIDFIAARSRMDMERLINLGYSGRSIRETGNLKYDSISLSDGFSREGFGFKENDLILLAASSRNGEEGIILSAWKELKKKHNGLKMIIAPRHIERSREISKLAKNLGIEYAFRTSKQKQCADCLIVDTFGELQRFYEMSDIVFVGGSLVNKGGQNPIEPAAHSKPVIFGPYMQNFLSEAAILKENGGSIQVRDKDELTTEIDRLISDAGYRKSTGVKAREIVEKQKGACNRTLEIINSIIN